MDIINGLDILIAFVVPTITVAMVFTDKHLIKKLKPVNQSIYQLVFRIPFLIFAAIATWNYTDRLIPYIIIFGLLDTITAVIYFWVLRILDVTTFQLLSMSNIIITLFIGAVIGFEIIENKVILGTIIFMVAVYLVTNINIKDIKGLNSSKEVIAIALKFVELTIKALKMFVMKELIISGAGSNETIIILSTLIQLVMLIVIFKPKLNLKEVNSKIYILQGFLTMLSITATGYAMVAVGVVTLNIVKTSSVIILTVVYSIIDKKLPTLKKSAGIILGTIGLIIIVT